MCGIFCLISGLAFFETKVKELCQNPVADLSEDLIERILWCLYSSEALLKLRPFFLKSLATLQPLALDSLSVIPFLNDGNKEVNTLRYDIFLHLRGTSMLYSIFDFLASFNSSLDLYYN